jgi:predicted AAA+ superfamily ATPase
MEMINIQLSGITVLSKLKETPLFQKYQQVFSQEIQTCQDFVAAYSDLCREIYLSDSPADIWMDAIRSDENALTRRTTQNPPSTDLMQAVDFDLQAISKLCALSGKDILSYGISRFPEQKELLNTLPGFAASHFPLKDAQALWELYLKDGYGFFALHHAFCMHEKPEAIAQHDPIQLSDLKGYQRQKDLILANTKAFLQGKAANNILLYGDKGTGKSSTVKAVANHFANEGLKIIELPSSELAYFPILCQEVEKSPYKFIVFLDDLNFTMEDENFRSMKAFIEGGIAGKPDNLIIYATSNRRHLVREGFRDREGDDVHVRDTLQSITALSDRFGLQITFTNPNRDEYLYIVDSLAEEYGIQIPQDKLHILAESFALRKSGRSPRCARQFISDLLTKESSES